MLVPRSDSHFLRATAFSISVRLVLLFVGLCCPATFGADARSSRTRDPVKFQRLLETVFGDAVRLDPKMRAKVLAGKPGERHYVDHDGDGNPEEVWFIDSDYRHPESFRPLLVKVIVENGDLKMGAEPDRQNALYVADWNADGLVDAVIEYKDRNGDGNLHEMVMYLEADLRPGGLLAFWARDVGGDHLLWFDVAYTYRQSLSQWKSHFGGDEEFCMFQLDETARVWVPTVEDPFCFYDRDRDGVSDEALRIVMEGAVKSIRHSFDADKGGTPANPHSYDVSLTALAPPDLEIPSRYSERLELRGIPTKPFLKFDLAPAFVAPIIWEKMQLTWVENAHNIGAAQGYPLDQRERWEGVINHGNAYFPRVGGPSVGPFNNRMEVVSKPRAPVRLYYHPSDHRLHLYNADHAWMEIDADMDYLAEMRYDFIDSDGDGVIDTWKIDLGAGGNDSWRCRDPQVIPVMWNWHDVNAAWEPVVRETPPHLFALDQRLEAAIRSLDPAAPEDPIFKLVRSGFQSPHIPPVVARKFFGSDATLRFYLEVIKDRLICDLKRRSPGTALWPAFDEARSAGDYDAMRGELERRFGLHGELEKYATWTSQHRAAMEPARVGWAKFAPSIGWESERVAYRCYWGHIDFFGKRGARLIYADMGGVRAPGTKWALADGNYHEEREWGMDALDLEDTPGAGGVTLYVNGHPFPVRSPGNKGPVFFESRLVSTAPDRVTVEMLATAVGPPAHPYSVRFRFTAIAGRQESPVEILVAGGNPEDKLELGIGLTKLAQEAFLVDTAAGVMGSWGLQSPRIGTIGMGIIFPVARFLRFADLADERQVIVALQRDVPLEYRIQCDWLRGRDFPVAPSASDWLEDLRRTATLFRQEMRVSPPSTATRATPIRWEKKTQK